MQYNQQVCIAILYTNSHEQGTSVTQNRNNVNFVYSSHKIKKKKTVKVNGRMFEHIKYNMRVEHHLSQSHFISKCKFHSLPVQ